jgi:hypothetical protein
LPFSPSRPCCSVGDEEDWKTASAARAPLAVPPPRARARLH